MKYRPVFRRRTRKPHFCTSKCIRSSHQNSIFFREFRVQLALQGYGRSVFLRYLEEALAETYAQLRSRGLGMDAIIERLMFPSSGYDITIAKARKEIQGVLLGPVNAGGMIWNVWANRKRS